MKRAVLLIAVAVLAACLPGCENLTPAERELITKVATRAVDRGLDKAFGPEKPVTSQK